MSIRQIVQVGEPLRKEATAYEAGILPGMFLEPYDDSGTRKYKKHSTVGGSGSVLIAVELAIRGISVAYAEGERVSAVFPLSGQEVAVLLKDGQVVTPEDFLTSNGDGTAKLWDGTDSEPGTALLRARQSASPSGADELIIAERV